jgi:protein-disulfide isomerase
VSLAGAAVEGNTRAPIAIIEYSDFQCPYCATFARETLPKLREKYVSPGKVLMAFRHFPLSGIHQLAERAAETAECAGRQGKFWEMHDQLFSKQKELGDLQMLKMAQQIHLDPTQFDRCLRGEATARVSQDSDSAKALGISGTPSFLIGNIQSDGLVRVARVLVGIQSLDQFDGVLAQITPPTQARR